MFNSGNNKTPIRVDAGKSIDTVSSEVVTFLTTAGATDSGEIAGTIVYGQLAKSPVLNKIGDREGEYTGSALSTSITFTTGVMDSTKEVGFVYDAHGNDRLTRTAEKVEAAGIGAWACDYFTGCLVICKATTGTSQTITSYKARSNSGSSVAIDEFPAAAALSDADSNPTTTSVGAKMQGWTGSVWQRIRSGLTAVTSTVTGYLNNIPFAQFNTTPTVRTNGQIGPLESDANGNLRNAEQFAAQSEDNTVGVTLTLERPTSSQSYVVSLDTSSAAEASSVTKASAGRLYGFVFSNGNGGVRYLHFFNATSVPADTAVPFLIFKVAANETLAWNFPLGIPFSTGICWANSSTQNTKTIGSADSLANVFYA